MRVFNCQSCGHLIFFESLQCVHCGSELAFLPETLCLNAIIPSPAPTAETQWQAFQSPLQTTNGQRYKLCGHRDDLSLCNFAIAVDDPHHLCVSCRQTSWLPDASNSANAMRWAKIEAAKRRLFYTLSRLGLGPKPYQPQPSFALLADLPGHLPIMTGHAGGTITINVVEADDDERAKRRLELGEPYRTLTGHLRHEVGHFFWDQLIAPGPWLEPFRTLFGDERIDYGQALQNYYGRDLNSNDWYTNFISAYATSHPWEDWAETWSHYLHMMDLLETAASYGTCVTLPYRNTLNTQVITDPFNNPPPSFSSMLAQWVPLTLLLNSLNRGLGHNDAYPFAISAGARSKLEFVHQVVSAQRLNTGTAQPIQSQSAQVHT